MRNVVELDAHGPTIAQHGAMRVLQTTCVYSTSVRREWQRGLVARTCSSSQSLYHLLRGANEGNLKRYFNLKRPDLAAVAVVRAAVAPPRRAVASVTR
eukprot:6184900-Pleurochrysis_carterae.AAC.2